jgi:plasmid maintenance system killer protein
VYRDLFRSEGSEIYMKNATSYIKPGVAVDFYTVLEAAKRKNHIAIGYRIEKFKDDPEKAYGIVINPDKPAIVHFANEDKLIVISED